jgi:hypothetical protein
VTQLGRARAVADPDDRQPRALRRHEGDVDAEAVGEQHRDARVARQTGGSKRARETHRARVVLRPRHSRIVDDECVGLGLLARPPGDVVADGRVTPPPGALVPDDFGRVLVCQHDQLSCQPWRRVS